MAKTKTVDMVVLSWTCPECGREMRATSKGALAWNKKEHEAFCDEQRARRGS